MLKKLEETIIKEFDEKLISDQFTFDTMNRTQKQLLFNEVKWAKNFILSALSRQRQEISKMIEESKETFKN